ncbi:TrmB family transcriptional regulator [Ferdinandcohnia quinoae]|uniref:TrmB family transcriptional regulator n=1 Tax=Fredinandcohnia quinoae TaxID=2918902 RepID=A0AAW5E2T0_9BACI|nr:TrmB family transcriptional regulator [Fredinandcohnia sp. SECRCQ15]MCH1626888.1 TrmB family transcriptional regulator [Fredinandcohnia sp. SECRCQ15]
MIAELRKIGMSDLEARCYLTLHEETNLSGYEVAKRVSVSRTNVYAALRSLTDKGICRVIETEPILYDAVPIDQLIKLMKSDFEQTSKNLLEQLKPTPQISNSFYSWRGTEEIQLAIRRLIANAKKTIVVDIWSEDLHWVEGSLLEAEKLGVSITVVSIGEAYTTLKNVISHHRSEYWNEFKSRKFSILCDFESALLGSFGESYKLTAIETNHPSLIELLQNGFYHDLVMETIVHDFKDEIVKKYGENYETILLPFKEYFNEN